MPWVKKYGSGFSCKDFSKQNKNRKKGANLLKSGQGTSGATYHGSRAVIFKCRPAVSDLENVQEACNDDPDVTDEMSVDPFVVKTIQDRE